MTFRPARFVPFMVGRRRIGWLAPELAARLAAWPAVFRCSPETVVLLKLEEFPSVVEALAAQGFIPGWRNERYRIAGLCDIERAAARPFGLTTHAVHVNGISDTKMWLARRSASKAIDPGLLDTLVGGGVTAGLSIEEVLVKEAWEEAGISPELARRASRGGTLEILREVPQGVQSEVVHVYDLVLPSDFEPRNQDGEVSEFCLLSVEEALACRELTLEAELSAKDYFSRRSGPPGSGRAGAGRRSGR